MDTSLILVSQSQFFSNKSHLRITPNRIDSGNISVTHISHDLLKTRHGFNKSSLSLKLNHFGLWESKNGSQGRTPYMPSISRAVVASASINKNDDHKQKQMTFVEELRSVAMNLHVKDPSRKGGNNETMAQILMKEKPSLDGYVKFLVDSKVVYDALEKIIDSANYSSYAELRNTGLERSGALAKDLEWLREEMGIRIPSPTTSGISYASYLEEIAVKNPKAIICHFYDIYFGLAAGGRMLGKRVQAYEKILENKELEFYKWNNGELCQLLHNAREKLNKVAQSWTREEKDRCLAETEISFKYSEDMIKLIIS
ncbi:hypothetical protein C5167_015800 [Papaver somniferum]|uniref:heme oxygenase (biliverdin-producing) n=1 Tax=Papaver somniferum TaxID=3469 RepID=A0A4Y7JAB0_PAPSO|nr:heme oxygenase 1, chloroplastic-like isoform X2 [Papaver somniferum]RZC56950.1 hypothetical protein C5167_015800 [Papaver somniferum]